jgi:hypothetical protein
MFDCFYHLRCWVTGWCWGGSGRCCVHAAAAHRRFLHDGHGCKSTGAVPKASAMDCMKSLWHNCLPCSVTQVHPVALAVFMVGKVTLANPLASRAWQALAVLPVICSCFPLDAAASIMDGSLMAAKQTDYMAVVQVFVANQYIARTVRQ